MAKVNYTGGTALKFKQPKYIVATLYGAEAFGAPSGDAYILETVVRDTTSVTQDDPETTDIECETSDSPIDTVTTLGKYQFTCEVADTQEDLVKDLMGWTKSGNKIIAPTGYTEKFVQVAIVFEKADKSLVAFVIPRMKLNSKLMLESMNSNIARVNLAGTANDWNIGTESAVVNTPFYMDPEYALPE